MHRGRSNILRSPRRLREIISAPEFVHYFGVPRPNAKDGRSSIFGREDELKNAPKGVAKDHPCVDRRPLDLAEALVVEVICRRDIDLLKCRSFAVVHQ